jgi:serine/threonine protein kinase
LCQSGHNHIVSVLRDGEVSETALYYLDMEYCDWNLEEYVAENAPVEKGPVWLAKTFGIMTDIANGVKFIHDHGEVHRDLKPQNGRSLTKRLLINVVLYCEKQDTWKLADFGLASQATSRRLHTSSGARGTGGYRAPELIMEEGTGRYNNKVDIFSMGCILFKLTFGRQPFSNDFAVYAYASHNRNLELHPNRFKTLQFPDLLEKMLARNELERPAARELISTFETLRREAIIITSGYSSRFI